MSLDEYGKKRDFDKTDEPKPMKARKKRRGLRFVVQKHDASRLHYDFRLEHDGVLLSWAVPKGPSFNPKDKRLAVQVEDHPYAYRNFEGTITAGEYGAGTVMLWDEGTWEPEGDAQEMLEKGSLKFTLEGERLKGRWALVRMKTRDADGKNWLLLKERDDFALTDGGISSFETSVRSGRTMEEIGGRRAEKKAKTRAEKTEASAKKAKQSSPPQESKTAARTRKAGKAESSDRKDDEPLELTSPEKEMYPGVTKKDVYEYYRRIAPRMMPYVQGRLASLVRCPGGTGEGCFYQKHLKENAPGIGVQEIREADGGPDEYLRVDSEAGLLSAAQLNAVEFHVWGSPADDLENANMITFDLDPDEGLDVRALRRGLKDLKSILDEIGLASFLKTSGSKGYHVVIPLNPPSGWEAAHAFARGVAQDMERKWPDRYTSDARKEERRGRIFVDWLRNARGATSVAPYSLRARDVPAVSCPIAWDEMDSVGPRDITIRDVFRRRKNPWKEYFKVLQKLPDI
ncbi:MAG TPA: non-homologous end-joining DNA ligase [Candidatus Limnocylindria bacterium]|nr:non-homologous end-joining DNA ligase [Candidatus Limnocylindria bacterium]